MTAGKTELPKSGHILRYVYLFREEKARGREEGVKERFVAVVGFEEGQYRVAAITTKGERQGSAIALPSKVAKAAGLSPDSSIVISELNRFTWPGYDIRPLMKKPGYIAGRLPPGFTNKIISEIKARGAKALNRD